MTLPTELEQWVATCLDGPVSATDVSWDRGDSQVWRVTTGIRAAYVKRSPTFAAYTREVRAYDHTRRALAAGEAPSLLASDSSLRAILTSPLPGRVVRGLPLETQDERRVYELAGSLLRRWHDSADPPSEQVRKTVRTSVAEQAHEAAGYLDAIAVHLSNDEHSLLQKVRDELPDLADELPLAYRHGDYSPRNWLWDADHGRHSLIDFEEASNGTAVEDLVWLHGAVWPTRPDLKHAFLTGYGRALTRAEQRALHLITTRTAAYYLHAGITKANPVLTERGRTALNHLLRTDEEQPR
ncbi:aminoglycoside phosphotransferase family protein [Saccharopolyspora taberi]|uniref:Aminoglycoside phosphotransferase family protein n=1 Tax=Saccharopolyspora taberi TaxID=60895 RepID=A0ABN3VF08_9PSEU